MEADYDEQAKKPNGWHLNRSQMVWEFWFRGEVTGVVDCLAGLSLPEHMWWTPEVMGVKLWP